MDDFEKLGNLVGASVEAAPGQGLPSTRSEALALGLPRYYTGKPCKHGHVAERHAIDAKCSECRLQFYDSPGRKEYMRRLIASPKNKAYKRQYDMKKTGDAALFAINQAGQAASRGLATTDIVPQCPEPHRSQLQALIDRIRADPTAGKAVIGLLRTMRELRKAELAQQRAAESTTAAESNT